MTNVNMIEKVLHYVRLSDILSEMSEEAKRRACVIVDNLFSPGMAAVGVVYYVPIALLIQMWEMYCRINSPHADEALSTLRKVHANNGNLETLMVDLCS